MTTAESSAGTKAHGKEALAVLRRYRRAADYLTAAQTYLRDDPLLRRPLSAADLKPSVGGGVGARSGGRARAGRGSASGPAAGDAVTLVYAHLDRLVRDRDLDVLLVPGTGDGTAALLANMYLDGTLAEFYPEMTRDEAGLTAFVRAFSWPGGFPSSVGPALPGAIVDGRDRGAALATAFGAAFDNPGLLVACIIGEDEAETAPAAAAWAANRYLEPANGGAVLPILALSGGATVFGTMPNEALLALFAGLGYEPIVVAGTDGDIDARMVAAFDQAADLIAGVGAAAREAGPGAAGRPKWPVLIVRTPPTAIPAPESDEAAAIEAWLRKFHPSELFDETGAPARDIAEFADLGPKRLGMSDHAIGGLKRKPLELPDAAIAAVPVTARGAADAFGLVQTSRYLAEVIRRSEDERNFRIFTPGPLDPDVLGPVLEVSRRAWQWGTAAEDARRPDLIVETQSEHLAEGLVEGYLKTGRHGLFLADESSIQAVDAQIARFAAWLADSRETGWRPTISSLNLLLSSDPRGAGPGGHGRGNPGFINSLLAKRSTVLRVTLPCDANTLVETVARTLHSTGYINLVVATRRPMPRLLSMAEARAHATAGASIWRWASTDDGIDPDVVLASAGAIPTNEVLATRELLARDLPGLRVRVVNVMDLMRLDSRGGHPHALSGDAFEALFTADKPVVFSFHGYPSAIHQLISARPNPTRFHVRGYTEEGATTTPFDLLVRNNTSRYQLAIEAIRRAGRSLSGGSGAIDRYLLRLEEHGAYIREHGDDPEEITAWRWSGDGGSV